MSQHNITERKIGVLGGGQLGRMMIQSAMDMNLDIAILDPDPNAPCAHLVEHFSVGKLTDFDTVYNFGKDKDLLTIEIENVNTEALKKLSEEGVKVFPQPEIIALIQDKRTQKQFYQDNDIPTAKFVLTETASDVGDFSEMLPAVHKLGKEGYDGRGVQVIKNADDLDKAFDKPGVLEKQIPFEKELSVIVARNESGETKSYPVVELSFHPTANLVEFLFSPAEISSEIETKAQKLAEDIIEKLDMVGILAVELFLTPDGQVLVNEVAPRTHNSGHQTIEGNVTSQFEQHLRAILDMPLGDPKNRSASAMVNLLGEDGFTGIAKYEGLKEILRLPDVHIHLYGKKMTKPFRKMGHITVVNNDPEQLKSLAREIKSTIKVLA